MPLSEPPSPPRSVVVVGGGIAGLATAWWLRLLRPDLAVHVLEAEHRVGGNVRTHRQGDCTVEMGPDAFLTKPGDVEGLCRAAGVEGSLTSPSPGGAKVLVAHRATLRPLPEGLAQGMPRSLTQMARTGLLSPLGKARAALDLVIPARREPAVSVGALVGRRFGDEVKHNLVEPVVGGIYGGDVDELDAEAVMPSIAHVRGSLLRALATSPKAPPPALRAPSEGIASLVEGLAAALGDACVLRGARVTSLARRGGAWSVSVEGGATLRADDVVLAVPPRLAAAAVCVEAPALAEHLFAFRMRPALTVALAFPREAAPVPHASGVLVPRTAPAPLRLASAVTFVHHKWPSRVPDDTALLRVAVRPSEVAALDDVDDEDVVARVLEALRALWPLPAPRWSHVARFTEGTPCPEVGHLARVRACREAAAAQRGLWLAGAAFDGPGIAGSVRGAEAIARSIAARHDGA